MTGKKIKVIRKTVFNSKPECIIVFSALLLLISASVAHGAFFDTAGQSARPMGMGEVFLASTGDASSYWYNPAGLSSCGGRQLGVSYGLLAPSIDSDLMRSQITYVSPLGETSGLGLGISYSGIDVANDMVISGAYGISLSDKFSVGGNLKVMRWATDGEADQYSGGKDDDLSKTSFSLDLSAAYAFGEMFGLNNFVTGMYVKDAIMPNISESGVDDGKLPIEVGIGVMGQKDNIVGELDVAFVNGETILRGGGELGITGSNLKLRGGLIYGSDFEDDTEKTDFDLGFSYVLNSLIFDYAYNLPIVLSDSGGRHYMSFGYSF